MEIMDIDKSYIAVNEKVMAKQSELNSALSLLNTAQSGEDENAISSAQANVDRIQAELEKIQKEGIKNVPMLPPPATRPMMLIMSLIDISIYSSF